MSNACFLRLPPELLYRIFDHLDVQTILCSIRLVSKRLYTVTNTYNSFEINFNSLSKPDVELISRLLRPKRITSIVFSNHYGKIDTQIDLFYSNFVIDQFTQLRSLTFLPNSDLDSRPNFHDIAKRILWPVSSTLRHLRIKICTYDEYQIILRRSPQLQTLVMNHCDMNRINATVLSSSVSTNHTELTSLTIIHCRLPIKNLQTLVSLTPSLVHLKISSESIFDFVFNGSLWEQFIRSRLPSLRRFEFFFVYTFKTHSEVYILNSIIDPFRSPFWLNEKRWIVTCDYVSCPPQIILYTTPAFKSNGQVLVRCEASSTDSILHMISDCTTKITDAAAEETLTVLDLGGRKIGATGTRYLADALPNLTTLITLNLRENHIGDEGTRYLADALQNSTSLATLHLKNNQIGASGAQYLGNALRMNTTLVTVDLSSNQLRNEGTQYMADALRDNKTLTTLSLRFNQIGNEGVQHLATALQNNKTLTSLDLGGNNIGALGAQSLANVLPNMALTELDLGGNNIGAAGTRYLAGALPNITTLIALNLESNDIETLEAQHLADALRNNRTLTKLNLQGNRIERDTVQTVKELLQKNAQLNNKT